MKRSEMINKLADIVHENRRATFTVSSEDLAEMLLKAIEECRMKPPGYMKPIPFAEDGYQYPLVPGDFQNDKGVWCTPGQQEWESEDET